MQDRWTRGWRALTVVLLALPTIGAMSVDALQETHCVVEVVGIEEGGELVMSEPRCHRLFAEAIADATDGALRLPATTGGRIVFSDAAFAAAAGSFVLGIHYDGFNGSGSSISVVGSTCGGGYWNTSTVWDNRISSSYNGCRRLRHYDGPSQAGVSQDTTGAGTTDNLTWLNNRTESVAYYSS